MLREFQLGDRVRLTELGIARNPRTTTRSEVVVALPRPSIAVVLSAFCSMAIKDRLRCTVRMSSSLSRVTRLSPAARTAYSKAAPDCARALVLLNTICPFDLPVCRDGAEGERKVVENDAPTTRSSDHVNFSEPASLRKWPSLGNQRSAEAANPYLVLDGTLGDCLRRLMAYAASTRHLYEIHTAPQPPMVREMMAGDTVAELARLQVFFEHSHTYDEW